MACTLVRQKEKKHKRTSDSWCRRNQQHALIFPMVYFFRETHTHLSKIICERLFSPASKTSSLPLRRVLWRSMFELVGCIAVKFLTCSGSFGFLEGSASDQRLQCVPVLSKSFVHSSIYLCCYLRTDPRMCTDARMFKSNESRNTSIYFNIGLQIIWTSNMITTFIVLFSFARVRAPCCDDSANSEQKQMKTSFTKKPISSPSFASANSREEEKKGKTKKKNGKCAAAERCARSMSVCSVPTRCSLNTL
jgi:hypothetical protein